MGLIGVIGFIGTPGIAGLLVAGMCEDKVTGSAVRHYTQGAFSPIRPIIPNYTHYTHVRVLPAHTDRLPGR